MTTATAHSGSNTNWWVSTTSAAAERGHGQPEAGELLVVELRLLAMPRPDGRPAGVVDAVRHRQAGVHGDTGERARQGEGDAVERVVVVVQHDHQPRPVAA